MDTTGAEGDRTAPGAVVVERADLDRLIDALGDRGYRVVGPSVRDEAIVYDVIGSAAELPEGWTDDQQPGQYKLSRRDDRASFGYAVGPHSWKQFLFPAATSLWRTSGSGSSVEVDRPTDPPRYAFLGVRGCEIRAIAIQDRVFVHGPVRDEEYVARREGAFIVAVNCGEPAATCFCTSMGTGPRAGPGYDIALTEVVGAGRHFFLAEPGTGRGAEVLAAVPHRPATSTEVSTADGVVDRAAGRIERHMDAGAARALAQFPEAARRDGVAERCLACGNRVRRGRRHRSPLDRRRRDGIGRTGASARPL
jgi:hypothetical protein